MILLPPPRRALLLTAFLAVACDGDSSKNPHDAADASHDASATRDADVRAPDARVFDSGHGRRDAANDPRNDASVADAGKQVGTDAGRQGDADAGTRDASSPSVADAGTSDAADGRPEVAPPVKIPGWSVRKRLRAPGGGEFALEQVLMSFLVSDPGRSRLERIGASGIADRSYEAPADSFLADFCVHPSGEISALLVVGAERSVSLVRLDNSLSPLSITPVHDSEVPNDLPPDPPSDQATPADLFVNGLATDAARIAPVGEDVAFVVYSSRYSVIAYRSSYRNGAWSVPARTLVEPPLYLAILLPTGGSFDTFGAIFNGYRAYVDTDDDGNAYVAVWAHPVKITAHVNAFHDGLTPLHPEIPHGSDSDVLVTRLDRAGTRAWSRVIGTENEDEPYAIHAAQGEVAVVGRSRRFFGNDNTAWDAFVSVSTAAGTLVDSRAIPFDASSIFLAATARADGTWVLGGSDGWQQNPEGLSIGNGNKLLIELAAINADPVRRPLPAGPRHNEVRTVSIDGRSIRYGGHQDGPSMHTGDADHGLITATGVLGSVAE